MHENTFLHAFEKYSPSPSSVLDVACGPGVLAVKLYDMGYEVTGFDISTQMMALFKENRGDRNIELIVGDLFTYTPKKQYDAVCCRYVFSHYRNIYGLLKNLTKFVNEDGLIFFDCWYNDSIKNVARLTDKSYYSVYERIYGSLPSCSMAEMEKICDALNLEIVSITPLSLFHRNPYFANQMDIKLYDKYIGEFYCKNEVREFLKFLQEVSINRMPTDFAGNYLNVVRKKQPQTEGTTDVQG